MQRRRAGHHKAVGDQRRAVVRLRLKPQAAFDAEARDGGQVAAAPAAVEREVAAEIVDARLAGGAGRSEAKLPTGIDRHRALHGRCGGGKLEHTLVDDSGAGEGFAVAGEGDTADALFRQSAGAAPRLFQTQRAVKGIAGRCRDRDRQVGAEQHAGGDLQFAVAVAVAGHGEVGGGVGGREGQHVGGAAVADLVAVWRAAQLEGQAADGDRRPQVGLAVGGCGRRDQGFSSDAVGIRLREGAPVIGDGPVGVARRHKKRHAQRHGEDRLLQRTPLAARAEHARFERGGGRELHGSGVGRAGRGTAQGARIDAVGGPVHGAAAVGVRDRDPVVGGDLAAVPAEFRREGGGPEPVPHKLGEKGVAARVGDDPGVVERLVHGGFDGLAHDRVDQVAQRRVSRLHALARETAAVEQVLLCPVGEAQAELGRGAQPRVECADVFRRGGGGGGGIADVDAHGSRIIADAVAVAVADEAVVGGGVAAVGAETPLGVPHVEAPAALRGALARGHPVIVGPVPHGRVGVAQHVVGNIVDVDILLGRGVGGGHRQIVGAQESDGVVPVDRVAAGESAHLNHVPERGAAVLLLHECFAQMLAEIVVALPYAVDVERDKGAA
ncbi:MAG: hypothetical protein BWX70_02476 [Verrucomicrobia bacterium ADurb.Bin070]|nr:MAG: hypothetical protein BWX70_02476 [Verrucomicrobia bacterium ADurb.Bin070]